ncbi:unnamed protein product [Staurois parvus]|uniref:Uncharacterized protein n=1 Tax=Staurois parvus TaxID=386267 RepID=A0ABN9BZL0_9NEOB|nr:unnamed protein product [Staurois parvus]
MSLLQCSQQCNPVDACICHLGSVPCDVGTYGDGTAGNLKMAKI